MQTSQRFILWGSVGLIIVFIVWGIMSGSTGPTSNTGNAAIPALTTEDHVRGKADSNTVVIEYSDFQCPACGAYEPIIQELNTRFNDRVAFVYRHFPLPQHQFALSAAYASEAAGNQGKFWEYHDLLFARQSSWSGASDIRETLINYAGELQLDVQTFKADLDSQAVKDRVKTDERSGTAANINGTPTFFLNGKQITNPRSADEFANLIDDALGNANQ